MFVEWGRNPCNRLGVLLGPSWGWPKPSQESLEGFLGPFGPSLACPRLSSKHHKPKMQQTRKNSQDSCSLGMALAIRRSSWGLVGAVWGRSGGFPWAIGLPSGTTGWCPQASGRARRTPEGFRAPGAKPGYNEGQGPVRARTASSGGQHEPRSEDTLGPHQVTTRDGLPCGPDRQALGGPHQVTTRAGHLSRPHRQGQSRLQRGPENPSRSHRPWPLLLGYIYIYRKSQSRAPKTGMRWKRKVRARLTKQAPAEIQKRTAPHAAKRDGDSPATRARQ